MIEGLRQGPDEDDEAFLSRAERVMQMEETQIREGARALLAAAVRTYDKPETVAAGPDSTWPGTTAIFPAPDTRVAQEAVPILAKTQLRIAILVSRVVLSLAVGCVALVGVSAIARPEPGPCRDTVTIPGSPMCIAPHADARLVFGSACAAIAVTWLGSGHVQRRLGRS